MALIRSSLFSSASLSPALSDYEELETYATSLTTHTISGATIGDYYILSGNGAPNSPITFTGCTVVSTVTGMYILRADATSFTIAGPGSGMFGAVIAKLSL